MESKIFYPHLSYKIVGALFEVYNELNYGYREKVYQKALEEVFKQKGISFQRELCFPIKFNNKIISRYYFDFLVENKIVLELKIAQDFYQKDINQLLSYLKCKGYRLGILALFTKEGIKNRRILN